MKIKEIILEDMMPLHMQRQFASNPALKQEIIQAYARLGMDKDWNVAAAKAIDNYSTKMDKQLSNKEKLDYNDLKSRYVSLAKQVSNIQQDKLNKKQEPVKKSNVAPSDSEYTRGFNEPTHSHLRKDKGAGSFIKQTIKSLNPISDIDTSDAVSLTKTSYNKGYRLANKILNIDKKK